MEAFFTLMFVWFIVWIATRNEGKRTKSYSDKEYEREVSELKKSWSNLKKTAKDMLW